MSNFRYSLLNFDTHCQILKLAIKESEQIRQFSKVRYPEYEYSSSLKNGALFLKL